MKFDIFLLVQQFFLVEVSLAPIPFLPILAELQDLEPRSGWSSAPRK